MDEETVSEGEVRAAFDGAKPRGPRVVYAITPEKKDRDGRVIQREGQGTWKEVGVAFWNVDDSINLYLDAIPITGRLQIRERRPRRMESGESLFGKEGV